MNPTPQTTIHELLEAHPYLTDWLAAYAPEFKKLKNPVLYNTVARVATIEAAASMGDTDVDTLLSDIRTEIAKHAIIAEEAAGVNANVDPGVRAARQEKLKEIISRLHDGEPVDRVKADFDALTMGVDAAEIAAMEQALIAEGMPVEEVMRLCDVHVRVFKDALEATVEATPEPELPADHPVSAYLRENEVATGIVTDARTALEAGDHSALGDALARLASIDTHYKRKENQLFPVLERHGVEGPTKVMWGLDDDIVGRLKTARALLRSGDTEALGAMLPELLTMIDDMIYKEEKILFPTAMQVITDEEWAEIAAGDHEIGYAWIEGPGGEAGPRAAATVAEATNVSGDESPVLLPLPTGALSLEQLDVMFRALPFDLTFVDEHDKVRFYSEGERVFPRSPAAIGRDVHNCHPPASVHKVVEILDAFKADEKDVAEFWIEMGPRFIHIRYFAMRDTEGAYRGCLEVVQDVTGIRALEGERRLVNW